MRDALLKIKKVPAERLNFKPWGATKLAEKARFAGRAAAVAGVLLEGVAVYRDEKGKSDRERARKETRRAVLRQLEGWIDEVMVGSELEPGPDRALNGTDEGLVELDAEVALRGRRIMQEIEALDGMLQRIDDYLIGLRHV
jgi:hypothetical protein